MGLAQSKKRIPGIHDLKISNLGHNEIHGVLDKIEHETRLLDEELLHGQPPDSELIMVGMHTIRKNLLLFNIALDKHIIRTHNMSERDIDDIRDRIDIIDKNLNLISDLHKTNLEQQQKNSVDTLTFITLLFLPLTLITGYYGMNFGSMGTPAGKRGKGIFTILYGETWVFVLFFVSIALALIFVKNKYVID
jgi:magnesium transporter